MERTVFIDDLPSTVGPPPDPRQGGFGAGDFELRELLSDAGGMALVYLAHQKSFGRKVVAKQLRPEFTVNRNLKACQAFREEGRKMASLAAHPNIVQVYYYDDASLTLFMEYIQGATLDACIAAQGNPPPEQAVRIALSILDGLSFIHKEDIIHLDIKPANIFILGPDRIKISDFGIASASEQTSRSGTPGYCSPEQATGAPVGPYSDVYAAGILLFEMLTGAKPFSAATMEDYASHIRSNPAPDVKARLPWLSNCMCAVISKSLAPNPDQRYQRTQDFHDELQNAWQAHLGVREIEAVSNDLTTHNWFERNRVLESLQQKISDLVDACPHDQEASSLKTLIDNQARKLRRQRALLVGTLATILVSTAAGVTAHLRQTPAEILIDFQSNVPDAPATVIIDGKQATLQVSPGQTSAFKVEPGTHTVELSIPTAFNIKSLPQKVTLKSSEKSPPISWSVQLASVLLIAPGIDNQDCIVDGVSIGLQAPCTAFVKPGEHTFEIAGRTVNATLFPGANDTIVIR